MRYSVNFSAGRGSWAAAKRAVAAHGVENVFLLSADTKYEDEDYYRFHREAVANIGAESVVIADGRNPWQVFRDERFLGNSRIDPCSKILKRQLLDRWRSQRFSAENTVIVVGIGWWEVHRLETIQERLAPWQVWAPMTEKPYMDPKDIDAWMRSEGLEPPKAYADGFPHNNCFAGDTQFITSGGVKSLKEMVGTECQVLGFGGQWRNAFIRHFGQQKLWRIEIARFNQTKTIYATAEHRWFVWNGVRSKKRREVITKELTPGDRLVSMFSGGLSSQTRPSPFGIAHGIVFGDGTRNDAEKSGYTNPATVVLCGEKDAELIRFFPLSDSSVVPGIGIRINDLPRYFKERPSLLESRSYLLGWLAGYFAADGSVSRNGDLNLSCANESTLYFVRDVCTRLGIGTTGIRKETRPGLGREQRDLYRLTLLRYSLCEDFFLLAEHRRRAVQAGFERSSIPVCWKVVSVTATDRVEDVFCATVPEGNCFTLEDNILTGNCGGRCVKQGQAGWRRLFLTHPERYLECEREEEAMREFLGKDVSMLKEKRKGKRYPLTLATLRERLEKDSNACDLYDEGGCGCGV